MPPQPLVGGDGAEEDVAAIEYYVRGVTPFAVYMLGMGICSPLAPGMTTPMMARAVMVALRGVKVKGCKAVVVKGPKDKCGKKKEQ